MDDQNTAQLPDELEPEPVSFKTLAKSIFSTIKTALMLSPLFVIVIIVVLAMLGPSIGNIFSNIVSAL